MRRRKPDEREFNRLEKNRLALDEFGIPRNTFNHRIHAGWSIEDALATPLGPTSKKSFSFEGENFLSRNNAGVVLSERYGMTKD